MSIDWDALVLAPVMEIFGEGEPADQSTWPLYTPRDLPAFRLADAVFDRAYSEVALDSDGQPVTTKKPCLGVRVSLFLRDPAQSDIVFVPATAANKLPAPGMKFLVKDFQPDGHGHAKLILMAAAS